MALKITQNVISVGIDDPSTRMFEAQYPVPEGMSYNSYVIIDEKIALLDSVEAGQGSRWIENVLEATDGRQPDFLVVHHMEPDHSACIEMALDKFPDMTLVASAAALKMLPQFFPGRDFSSRTKAVKDHDSLDLGKHSLQFLSAPMVHWPEVMVTFETHTGTLFSADAFGKFGAIQFPDDWVSEARRYYVNIVGRYGAQVQALLKKINGLGINRIAPLHGPVLDHDIEKYVDLYNKWSLYQPEDQGVLVAYASIYGGTEKAALEIADSLRNKGIDNVVVLDLSITPLSEAVSQAFRLSHMVLASPTYDSGLFPVVYDFIHHLNLKNFRNRTVAYIENGSWAPTAARRMQDLMATMPGMTDIQPVVTVRSRLDNSSRAELGKLADALADSLSDSPDDNQTNPKQ